MNLDDPVSINSVEPRHSTITDLEHGRETMGARKLLLHPDNEITALCMQQEVEPEKCSYRRNLSQPMKSQL